MPACATFSSRARPIHPGTLGHLRPGAQISIATIATATPSTMNADSTDGSLP